MGYNFLNFVSEVPNGALMEIAREEVLILDAATRLICDKLDGQFGLGYDARPTMLAETPTPTEPVFGLLDRMLEVHQVREELNQIN
jgi:hypothetical protein